MSTELLQNLVNDASLVADVGVRLGLIKSTEFLPALSAARYALENDSVSPEVIAALQKGLNSAANDILPITLNDLRAGWRPSNTHTFCWYLGIIIFGIFCFLLLISIAYLTQIYNRANSLYTMTIELQETRGAEQTIRLFGLLRKNQKDVIESLTTGQKDFLYETFNKALYDLQLINTKFQAYGPIAIRVLNELDIYRRLRSLILYLPTLSIDKLYFQDPNPTQDPRIREWLENYKKHDNPASLVSQLPQLQTISPDELQNKDIHSLLRAYFTDIRNFTSSINVNFDPLVPNDYSFYLYKLQEGIGNLGSWILPSLYGMLGAAIFHMRRLLEPSLPNPSWLRFVFRIVLGGFAGIILVWFWTPQSQKLTQPSFATLTSFGLAFLIGFSTDVFFQALDRLVNYMSQAVGKAGT